MYVESENVTCSLFISFVWQRYGKRHDKALGKARKMAAEGKSLKVVSEFVCGI